MKPSEVGIGGSPAVPVITETRNRPIINDLTVLVAPSGIRNLAYGKLCCISGD
ncbi:uncharacterized protein METZ01_LOCUS40269 [marine metagenome]|uniref:Uncharacterized protein n=1 Tax=marine metagenome TaxID=408172 RepID=A0A381R6P7_9ZZZZ